MSSISSATSQPPFVQIQQNAANKTDASKTDTANADSQVPTPLQTAQQTIAAASAGGLPESRYFRNGDGTYGPGHTALPPFNPLKPSADQTQQQPATQPESADVGVNVKI